MFEPSDLEEIPHTVSLSRSGDEHVCTLHTTMPDGSVMSFTESGATEHAAREVAMFKASFAVKCARDSSLPPSTPEQRVQRSSESPARSLDVEFQVLEPENGRSSVIADTCVDNRSSDDDVEGQNMYVGSEAKGISHNSIAFVPAPESRKKEKEDSGETIAILKSDENAQYSSKTSDGNRHPEQKPSTRCDDYSTPSTRPRTSTLRHTKQRCEANAKKRLRSKPVTEKLHGRAGKRKHLRVPQSSGGMFDTNLPQDNGSSARGKLPKSSRSAGRVSSDIASSRRAPEKANCEIEHRAAPDVSKSGGRTLRQQEQRRLGNEGRRKPQQGSAHVQYSHPSAAVQPLHFYQPPHHPQIHQRNEGESFPGSHNFPPRGSFPMPLPPPYPPAQVAPHAAMQGMFHQMPPPFQDPFGGPHPNPGTLPPYMPLTHQPNANFPLPMFPHPMGGYCYPTPFLNGDSQVFCPSQTCDVYTPTTGNKSGGRDAEIAAVAQKVATEMASQAAAKDAAEKAREDFEAAQKKRRRSLDDAHNDSQVKNPTADQECRTPCHDTSSRPAKGKSENPRHRQNGGDTVFVEDLPLDDDDHEDYVSQLNMMAQKGKKCTNLTSPAFLPVRAGNSSHHGQQCTMSVRVIGSSKDSSLNGAEGITIKRSVIARNRKKSKQMVAKEILKEIGRMNEGRMSMSEEEEDGEGKGSAATSQKKNLGITTATAALHRMYTLNALTGPPQFKAEEPAGSSESGLWRSILLLDVVGYGKHTFAQNGPSKKVARQQCALKALIALKDMGVPNAELFTEVCLNEKNAQKEKTSVDEDATPTQAIVHTREHEGADFPKDVDIGDADDRLVLPKGYKLLVAENDFDCEEWFRQNGLPGSHLGVYVDSPQARSSIGRSFRRPGSEVVATAPSAIPKFVCFSSPSSGIVIHYKRPHSQDAGTDSPQEGDVGLPEVVIDALENPNVQKHSLDFGDGISILEDEEDFQGQAFNDIAITSHAITGMGGREGKVELSSFSELVHYWLKKRAKHTTWTGAWRDTSDLPLSVPSDEGDIFIAGALASFACYSIREQMTQEAKRKRTQKYGTAAEFLELCKRLMSTAVG